MSRTTWLSHVTVLDAGSSAASRYCGWLFVQNGARVLGSGARPSDQLTPAALDFLDTGKEPGTEPYAAPDVVLVDAPGPAPVAGRLTGVVDPYGPDGPHSGWAADEVTIAARGGAAAYTTGRDGTPVYGFGLRYQYLAGLYLYTALVGELAAARSGSHEVRVSLLETVASVLPYPTTQYAYNGSDSLLEQSGPRFVVACADGWVVVYAGLAWPAITGLLSRPDLDGDRRFVELGDRFAHVDELRGLFDAWGATRTVAEALAGAAAHDVAAAAVRSPAQVLDDPDLAARGAWHEVRGGGRAPTIPNLLVTEGVDT
ncbi:CoA transferase [Streptomyces sp. NPDC047070]|uniref:CoA transferase n=1 Tax=Streptomyces sp. NPDC047070 TaxID=3154923 RepID=UPI00345734D0